MRACVSYSYERLATHPLHSCPCINDLLIIIIHFSSNIIGSPLRYRAAFTFSRVLPLQVGAGAERLDASLIVGGGAGCGCMLRTSCVMRLGLACIHAQQVGTGEGTRQPALPRDVSKIAMSVRTEHFFLV